MSVLFKSRLLGGFECSTHRRRDGRRLDMIAATRHDEFAFEDHRRLADLGIKTARDGIRWHLIERLPGKFDFSTVERQMEAAARTDVGVIWDLFHYGYPDHVEIFSGDFPKRLAALANAFAEYYARNCSGRLFFVPVNEISFFSFIAGDIGRFHPFATGRGNELKRQLVRAALGAIDAVREILPDARTVMSEPATFIRARPEQPEFAADAEAYRTAQYEAFDMISGRIAPELGGRPEHLDIIGINYYPHNQWFYPDREMIPLGDYLYRPLSDILKEVSDRYERPMFLSETGTEDDRRAGWFRYVAQEVRSASARGVDLHGICLYPIVNHPGWEDERHCHNGLWDYCGEDGDRCIHEPLEQEARAFLSGSEAQAACASNSRPLRPSAEPAMAWA
jgi:beta-glucosidase/6-phospho-beta-glucosidase/beta-galactosidase